MSFAAFKVSKNSPNIWDSGYLGADLTESAAYAVELLAGKGDDDSVDVELEKVITALTSPGSGSITLDDMFWTYLTIIADEYPSKIRLICGILQAIRDEYPHHAMNVLAIELELHKHLEV